MAKRKSAKAGKAVGNLPPVKSVRLTNDLRKRICNVLLKSKNEEAKQKLLALNEELYQTAYREMVPPEMEKLLDSLPHGVVMEVGTKGHWDSITYKSGNKYVRRVIEFKLGTRLPWKYETCISNKKIANLADQIAKVEDSREQLRMQVMSTLSIASTTTALVKMWPEARAAVEEVVGGSGPGTQLMPASVAILNQKLELTK